MIGSIVSSDMHISIVMGYEGKCMKEQDSCSKLHKKCIKFGFYFSRQPNNKTLPKHQFHNANKTRTFENQNHGEKVV